MARLQTSRPSIPDTVHDAGRRSTLRGLLNVRISSLSELLRRSSILANRRTFGLSWIDWRVVSQVGEHAPLTLNSLAELLNLDPGQVSRAVKGLTGRGLLHRTRRPGGPSIVITLTDEGAELHARMADLAIARYEFLVSDVTAQDIERVARVLDALGSKAQLLLERERAANEEAAGDPA